MPTYAANLNFFWSELEPFERFRAAARFGFRRVEFLFPQRVDTEVLAATLQECQLELVLFDTWPGESAGESGYLALPGQEDNFHRTLEEALVLAGKLGTSRLNVLGGILPTAVDAARAQATAIANLSSVAHSAAQANVSLLLENINPIDRPGYAFPTPASVAEVVKAVGHPSVGMQFDFYHAARAGLNPLREYQEYRDLVRHVQLADAPGRHQPGTGEQQVQPFLDELDRGGYSGLVGLEYAPTGTTEDGLSWLDGGNGIA